MENVIKDEAIPCVVVRGKTISELVTYVRVVLACGKLHLQHEPFLCKTSSNYMEVMLKSQNSNKSNADLITFFNNAATMCLTTTRKKMTIVVYGNPATLLSISQRIRHNYESIMSLSRVILLIGNDASETRTFAECRRRLNGFACFLNLKSSRPNDTCNYLQIDAHEVAAAFKSGNVTILYATLCRVLKYCKVSELLRSLCIEPELVKICVDVDIAMQSQFGNLHVFLWLIILKQLQFRASRNDA